MSWLFCILAYGSVAVCVLCQIWNWRDHPRLLRRLDERFGPPLPPKSQPGLAKRIRAELRAGGLLK